MASAKRKRSANRPLLRRRTSASLTLGLRLQLGEWLGSQQRGRRLTLRPCSRSRSCRTTSALPRCRWSRVASQSSIPASADGRSGVRYGVHPPPASRHVPPDRRGAAPEFPGNPSNAPSQRLQPDHRRDLVRLTHNITPIAIASGDNFGHLNVHQDLLAQEGASSSWRQGSSFPCRLTTACPSSS